MIKGEWHFSWVLEGMAVQDVIVLPDFEYGTTLRVYNPDTHAWDVAYFYTGKIMRFEARKQDGIIVLTNLDTDFLKLIAILSMLVPMLGIHTVHWTIFSLLAAPLIFRPTHTGVKINRWFFYIFYPAHLAIIVLLKYLLTIA